MRFSVGVDLHKHQMTVHIKDGKNLMPDLCSKFRTTNDGYDEFTGLLTSISENKDCQIAVESTGNTRYFVKKMQEKGLSVKIVNIMKFKVINESINKTDKHDANTLSEFLQKDMIPEVKLCSKESKDLRAILKHRKTLKSATVSLKNQIHCTMLENGIETRNGQLNSIRGREKIIEQIDDPVTKTIVSNIIKSIEILEEEIKKLEEELRLMSEGDNAVKILQSIPGTGFLTAVKVRAYLDDIKRFSSYEKLSSYCGLVPWVQSSDTKSYYGQITKRGPQELRTAFIQMAIGMMRVKIEKNNRYMLSYQIMKRNKGSGKAIVATARKLTKLVWTLLTEEKNYDPFKSNKIYKSAYYVA